MVFRLYGALVAAGPEYALLSTGIPAVLDGANALMVKVWPPALTQGPAPPPLVSPVTLAMAGVASGYAQSGGLKPSANAETGTTGVSKYCVSAGMNGFS